MATNYAPAQLQDTTAGAQVTPDSSEQDLLNFEHEWYILTKLKIAGGSALDRHERNLEMKAGVLLVFEGMFIFAHQFQL